MNRTLRIHTIALAVLLTGAACATDPAPAPAPQADLMVTGTDQLSFEPDVFRVEAGAQVTLELTAEGSVNHTFVVESADQGADLLVAEAGAGETVTGSFAIAEEGSYQVFCSVPGHREAGMVGLLTATG